MNYSLVNVRIDRRAALAALAALLGVPPPVTAARAHGGVQHTTPQTEVPVLRLRGSLPDARVTDLRRRRRLVSEVIAGRVVAVDFVLTDCTTFCNTISASMAATQELLGRRLGREAGLLSIAIDPVGGTPERLREYAARFEPGPAWSFVSIPGTQLDEVVRVLGGPVGGGTDHAPVVVVFDPARGELRRLLGTPAPAAIAGTIEAALAARHGAGA